MKDTKNNFQYFLNVIIIVFSIWILVLGILETLLPIFREILAIGIYTCGAIDSLALGVLYQSKARKIKYLFFTLAVFWVIIIRLAYILGC